MRDTNESELHQGGGSMAEAVPKYRKRLFVVRLWSDLSELDAHNVLVDALRTLPREYSADLEMITL